MPEGVPLVRLFSPSEHSLSNANPLALGEREGENF
jgi:hypothetical protein